MTHKKYAFRDYNRIKNGPKSLSVVKIVIYGELHILYFSLDIQQIAGFLKKNRFFFSVTFKWILFLFWGTVSYNAPNKSTTAAFSKQIKKHETKQKANWWILQCITKRFLRVYATHYVESFRVFFSFVHCIVFLLLGIAILIYRDLSRILMTHWEKEKNKCRIIVVGHAQVNLCWI